ncbi:MAG: hypothetical protein ACERKD_15910 [Prolixibacteraceae bacterium]
MQIATPEEPDPECEKLKKAYNLVRKKYIKAYDDLPDAARNPMIDLSKPANREILIQTLLFWEGKKSRNLAFTIMPNHLHSKISLSSIATH